MYANVEGLQGSEILLHCWWSRAPFIRKHKKETAPSLLQAAKLAIITDAAKPMLKGRHHYLDKGLKLGMSNLNSRTL